MSLQITGTIHKIFDTKQITDTFKKREFVLSIESGPYTETPPFEMVQDRCDLLDEYKEGDQVVVHFDLRGREHNGKYYGNLRCWKLDKVKQNHTEAKLPPKPEKTADNTGNDNEVDPLPF